MKAQIYVNRHKMAANKKATKETGLIVDRPAIAVNTYKGSVYVRLVQYKRTIYSTGTTNMVTAKAIQLANENHDN